MKTCLNRLIGKCKDCIPNYDLQNRPNNYDCKGYQEANIQTLKVEGEIEKNALGRKISSEKI
jgi:hypothetical protein